MFNVSVFTLKVELEVAEAELEDEALPVSPLGGFPGDRMC